MKAKIFCKITNVVLFEATIKENEKDRFISFLTANGFVYNEYRDIYTNGKRGHECILYN